MSKEKITVSIVGGSGYAGGELLRILEGHPNIAIAQVTSNTLKGKPVKTTHPNLRDRVDINFGSVEDLEKCDVLFVALPNGESANYMDKLRKLAPYVIDMGSDFRLQNSAQAKEFIYGLAEINREKIKKAKLVACGGCEATAIILALWPLVQNDLLDNSPVIADVKIGSSAAGNKPKSSTHHPERHGVLRSYKPTGHRHELEVKQETGRKVEMSATAVNIVRGILATIHTRIKKDVTEKDVWVAYKNSYGSEPFIRIVKTTQGFYRYPEPKILWGTNFCDIGFEKDPKTNRLVVMSAIDNLVKGTAGQGIQAMNIMLGYDETLGLEFSGLHPV